MSSVDKLTIDTPEQTALEFPLAGVGSRFLAIAADTAIQVVTIFVLVIVALSVIPTLNSLGHLAPQWVFALLVFVGFLITSGYYAFFETIWNGQTPGKRLAQIRVMKDDGRPINAYDAIARNLLRVVDQLPAAYGIAIISVLFSEKNKRLGDFVAGTVVVHEKTLEAVRPYTESAPDQTLPAFDSSNITLEELRLIETFVQRRDSLDPLLRGSMATQICARISQKVGVNVYGWPRNEKFLEAVLQQCRDTGRFRT
jgi:uncharacterized RDD family membrane protein YckC